MAPPVPLAYKVVAGGGGTKLARYRRGGGGGGGALEGGHPLTSTTLALATGRRHMSCFLPTAYVIFVFKRFFTWHRFGSFLFCVFYMCKCNATLVLHIAILYSLIAERLFGWLPWRISTWSLLGVMLHIGGTWCARCRRGSVDICFDRSSMRCSNLQLAVARGCPTPLADPVAGCAARCGAAPAGLAAVMGERAAGPATCRRPGRH